MNNLKIALRFFLKPNRITVLNISGLVIGITLFLLISLLLNYEISFDGFHPNKNKILQVCEHDLKSGEIAGYTAFPLPLTLKNDFSEIKHVTGVWDLFKGTLQYNNIEYSGFTGASVEPDFFNIFDYKLILGDIRSVLTAPDQIAVSKSLSEKIFGGENPVGKVITIDKFNFTISHLYNDLPNNSSVQFDLLFSDKIREMLIPDYKVAWWNGGIKTYVILQDNYPVEQFDENLKKIPGKYYPDFLKGRSTFVTIPFKTAHFNASILAQSAVSYSYILILGTISFIILLIACINYINLTLARAFKLNTDAGIRRIVGAGANHIISVQIWYAFLSVLISLLLSAPLSLLLLPFFEKLAGRELTEQLNNQNVWLVVLGASVLASMISGYIPGKFFSKVRPINILKGKGGIKTFTGINNGLVIFQFSLALTLIITQFFILKQISFMKNADLGYDNDNLISVDLSGVSLNAGEKYEKCKLYKEEIEKSGPRFGLTRGSITENIPGYYFQNSFTIKPVDAKIEECLVISTAVDENYSDIFRVAVVEGRFFSPQYGTDRQSFIINKTAMKKFGWENIEGKFLKLSHEGGTYPVIGVMKDINLNTLKEPIRPMVYRFGPHNNFPAFITYRVNPEFTKDAINLMKNKWENIFSDVPFNYLDVKETYFKNYEEEKRLSQIIGIFTVLAVALSLLGLFGLTIFYSEGRTKEIGIRKVNGAKIIEIVYMLNESLIKKVAVAFIIGSPVAWFAIKKWIENFAYKTELSWWGFAIAGAVVMAIALITVSIQSLKAAMKNPVEALRYE